MVRIAWIALEMGKAENTLAIPSGKNIHLLNSTNDHIIAGLFKPYIIRNVTTAITLKAGCPMPGTVMSLC